MDVRAAPCDSATVYNKVYRDAQKNTARNGQCLCAKVTSQMKCSRWSVWWHMTVSCIVWNSRSIVFRNIHEKVRVRVCPIYWLANQGTHRILFRWSKRQCIVFWQSTQLGGNIHDAKCIQEVGLALKTYTDLLGSNCHARTYWLWHTLWHLLSRLYAWLSECDVSQLTIRSDDELAMCEAMELCLA